MSEEELRDDVEYQNIVIISKLQQQNKELQDKLMAIKEYCEGNDWTMVGNSIRGDILQIIENSDKDERKEE